VYVIAIKTGMQKYINVGLGLPLGQEAVDQFPVQSAAAAAVSSSIRSASRLSSVLIHSAHVATALAMQRIYIALYHIIMQ